MAIGFAYRNYEKQLEFLHQPIFLICMFLLYLGFTSIFWIQTGKSINFTPTKLIFDGWLITILGLGLCIGFSKNIKIFNNYLSFIGANSLLYFALHGKAISLLQAIVNQLLIIGKINVDPIIQVVLGFVLTFLSSIILMLPVLIINKYLPWTIGKGYSLISHFPNVNRIKNEYNNI